MPITEVVAAANGAAGIGATLALPFLDAMVPAFALRRRTAKPVHRFQTFYVPNGMAMEVLDAEGRGRDVRALADSRAAGAVPESDARALGPQGQLELHPRRRVGIVSHRHDRAAAGTRSRSSPTCRWTSCSRAQFAKETQLASLELSMDAPGQRRRLHRQSELRYTHTISWRSPTQPLPMEYNPRAVFEKLFGDSGSTDRAAREARLQQHKSILDSVNEKLARPEARARSAGSVEGRRVHRSRFATSNGAFERAEEQRDVELPTIDQPQGVPPVFEDHLALMLDLQLLAFQSDLTRVITFMISKEQSARPYPQIGVPEAHHPLSHHSDIPELDRAHVEDQPVSHASCSRSI